MFDVDAHLEMAYEDRYQVDADDDWYAERERDWDEEREAYALDKDECECDPDRDGYAALTGDDMEQEDQGPVWIIAPGY